MIKIGYGIADFETMVQDDLYYVDRTQYITKLENASSRYIAFLRPRRFGKSMWVSVLQCYYGVQFKDKFDALFGNYYIGTHPTKAANSYLILRFNFSAISTDTDDEMEDSFLYTVREGIIRMMDAYPQYFNETMRKEVLQQKNAHTTMKSIFQVAKNMPYKIYLLLDEYDHFANELLTLQRTAGQPRWTWR